ncbi:MAG TPA: ferric reductase-like transmembrane domain-containing protein, partial [Anaerovoracaceae bacterium]|nr:ferric reductase-like transmembrane domain-containing protein [Anaerovoracaceae bacterium]
MKSIKGKLLIFITMIITLLVWLTAVPSIDITALDKARHILAGLGLNGLFLVFLLSTRNNTIVKWFDGLDHVYAYHRYLGMFSGVAIIAHVAISQILKVGDAVKLGTSLAGLSMFLFVAIGLITLLYNKYFSKKLKYERWRLIHRFMLAAYMIGLGHTYLSSRYDLLQFNLIGIWTGVTSVIGVLSGIYIIFLYQKTGFKHIGTVMKIEKLNSNVLEMELTLKSRLDYQKGQYVFLKIFQQGIENAPHPFSISGGDGNHIILTVKASGDHTKQLYDALEIGTKAALDGPYG